MQDRLNMRVKSIVMVALVGLPLAGALLVLGAQEGARQGGRQSAEGKQLARLQVNFAEESSFEHSFGGRHERKVERKTLEAAIVFEFPEGMEQLQETTCEELEKTIRQTRKDCAQLPLPGELCVKSIREMEEGARKCRETIPTYGFSWSAEDRGVISVPGPITLVSFTGQASYFREEKSEEQRFGHCMPGIRPTKIESTYFSTEKGNGTLRPGRNPIEGAFNVNVMGDRVFGLVVYGNSFDVTGHWKKTYKTICDSGSETGPTLSSKMRITAHFPVTGTGPDPDWQVQVSRTANGYSGNASYKKQDEGGWIITKTVSYTLDIGEAIYEVVVTPPKNLKDWIPKGGKDENTPGDQIKFIGQVQEKKGSKGGKAGGSRKVKVAFELTSSREPGIAMNFPPKDLVSKPPRPDLRILKEGTSSAFTITDETKEDGPGQYKAEGEFKVGESFDLVVGSFDYGAYGYLNVSADAPVRIKGHPDTNRLWLPKDDNMNSIADKWEEKDKSVRGGASDSDEDSKPEGDGTPGDGLSLYEEYRGFMVQRNHIRTNPKYKDLFIFDQNNLTIGEFARSGLVLHLVKNGEFVEDPEPGVHNPNVINFNAGTAHLGKQHLLRMKNGPVNGAVGVVLPENVPGAPPGPPKTVRVVIIDVSKLGKKTLPSIIAHELAHGSNVVHHGMNDYKARSVQGKNADGNWEPWGSGEGDVAAPGGQHSGVQQCIMRYNSTANLFEVPGGRYRWRKVLPDGRESLNFINGERYPPFEDEGTIYCEKPDGTGVNAPGGFTLPDGRKVSKAGKAARGSCKKQFCVNDTRPCQFKL